MAPFVRPCWRACDPGEIVLAEPYGRCRYRNGRRVLNQALQGARVTRRTCRGDTCVRQSGLFDDRVERKRHSIGLANRRHVEGRTQRNSEGTVPLLRR